ncbi:hypothetical protein KM043_008313 [Ampulex compressa]|nr:hypothetical protein KM043_008313 [Ampulex compressa]
MWDNGPEGSRRTSSGAVLSGFPSIPSFICGSILLRTDNRPKRAKRTRHGGLPHGNVSKVKYLRLRIRRASHEAYLPKENPAFRRETTSLAAREERLRDLPTPGRDTLHMSRDPRGPENGSA